MMRLYSVPIACDIIKNIITCTNVSIIRAHQDRFRVACIWSISSSTVAHGTNFPPVFV